MSDDPIGVFDSGLGGLSVWRELRRCLSHESLYYFGDGKNCPYGSKPQEDIVGFVEEGVKILMDEGIKMLVVACNAATASAVSYLRQKYDFPIVGMEPAVKPAAITTKTGVIGVLATRRTLDGELFGRTAAQYSDRARIVAAVGERFVEIVENGQERSSQALEQVSKVLEPILNAGADRIVLGCTHYPFLREAMQEVIGGRDVEIIDSSGAIARRVEQLLDDYNLRASCGHVPQYRFFSAADSDYIEKIAAKAGG